MVNNEHHIIPENKSLVEHVRGPQCWCHPILELKQTDYEVTAVWSHRGELLTSNAQYNEELI